MAALPGFRYTNCASCQMHKFVGGGWTVDLAGHSGGTACLPFPGNYTGTVFANTGLTILTKSTNETVRVIRATSEENDFTLTFVNGHPQVTGLNNFLCGRLLHPLRTHKYILQ
jgi:hypothetical protein